MTQVVPGSQLEFAPGAGPDKRYYRVNCEKIRRVLPAFEPQWTAQKGVEELYKAYCDVGLTLEDFEGRRFHRLAHLKYLIEDRIIADDLRHLKQHAAPSEGLAQVAAGD